MTDEERTKDWGEYEAKGVPVLDFLLAIYDDRMTPEEFRTRAEWLIPSLAELWIEHHPERQSDNAPVSWSGQARAVNVPEPAQPSVSHLVPACGHVSDPDVSGKRHTCFLPQSHEGAGIAHEDSDMKWYRAQPKPFKKVAT